jgi:hypothetical protein
MSQVEPGINPIHRLAMANPAGILLGLYASFLEPPGRNFGLALPLYAFAAGLAVWAFFLERTRLPGMRINPLRIPSKSPALAAYLHRCCCPYRVLDFDLRTNSRQQPDPVISPHHPAGARIMAASGKTAQSSDGRRQTLAVAGSAHSHSRSSDLLSF